MTSVKKLHDVIETQKLATGIQSMDTGAFWC
jgi:hypothetical protein